ncbi:MAG TPA: radical SAM protein, partial [Syntrophales bacterium]|nr:radical SAM protein [Syntrophales bacterium]
MIIKEIHAKSIVSPSKIYTYVINPYVGCHYGCTYCYARYMKRFTGHREPWGDFVDIKANAVELLRKEITKKKPDCVWISGVCDPYQPIERKYKVTRGCMEILVDSNWPVRIQTKSDLVVRDLDILKKGKDCDVGLSIGTADDGIRRLFEPKATKIEERIDALKELHAAGIQTYAMIAPVLPGAEELIPLLDGMVDYLYVDRMNYGYAHHL